MRQATLEETVILTFLRQANLEVSTIILTRYTHIHHVPHAEHVESCRSDKWRSAVVMILLYCDFAREGRCSDKGPLGSERRCIFGFQTV